MATPAPETVGPLAAIRRTWRLFAMATWTPTIVSWEAVRALFWRGDRRVIIDRAKHAWAIVARFLLNVDIRLVRGQMPPRHHDRARVVVCNHRTPLDIVSLMWLFDGHFLANHKTRTAPVVGTAAIRMGTIFVDREDRRSGANAIRAMRRAIEDKQTIIIFPEGTTYVGDEVRPFKGGVLLAAKGMDVDVIPVGLAYPSGTEFGPESLGQHAKRFLSRKTNRVWVAIGEPRPFSAFQADTRDSGETLLRAAVQEMVNEARRAATADGAPAPAALPPTSSEAANTPASEPERASGESA
jgi:1-acyl-sn-glycerol-3-phosphate acyltransferase